MATIRVGISGWRYKPWRGTFYPQGWPQHEELWFASRRLKTIEINGSFYSLQRPESFTRWHEQTPADFVFAVKGSRYITHMKRLRDVTVPLANFLASGLFNLREKLGPILWQFPPNLTYDPDRFAAFLALLPEDTEAASHLARRRDARVKGRARLAIDAARPMRHAIEVRHQSFCSPQFIDQLRNANVALVVAETARKWPMLQDVTADFMYLRLHGDKQLYASGYSDRALDKWARRISGWHRGGTPGDMHPISPLRKATKHRDVFCYFDNTDVKLRAPHDAQELARKLRLNRPLMRTGSKRKLHE